MNTYKHKANKMLNTDIISPEMVVAEFSDQLVAGEAAKIVNNLNCGQEMLQLFGEMRDDLHILNVTQFLTDVTTAAGLLAHGKRDKGLANRIADRAHALRMLAFGAYAKVSGVPPQD